MLNQVEAVGSDVCVVVLKLFDELSSKYTAAWILMHVEEEDVVRKFHTSKTIQFQYFLHVSA